MSRRTPRSTAQCRTAGRARRKTLAELFRDHRGKVSDKWASYLDEYDRIFAHHRSRPVSLLEIGVQNGGSLEIWSKYFRDAVRIVGCDINPACASLTFDDPRISVLIGDATSAETETAILGRSKRFDIIIDDGSHRSSDVIKSFARYFPYLAPGGIYVVEDAHSSYWREYGGGLYYPFSAIAFFKRLADVINHAHWGVPKTGTESLKGFLSQHGFELSDDVLDAIHSVEFTNSLCIVRSDAPERNRLNERVIAGTVATVEPAVQAWGSTPQPVPDQSNNEWTVRAVPPDEELQLRLDELKEQSSQLQQLTEAVRERDRTLTERDHQVSAASAVLAERETQLTELQERAQHLTGRLHDNQRALDELRSDYERLNAALDDRAQEIQRQKTEIAALRAHLGSLYRSRSWRITAPLRAWRLKLFRSVDARVVKTAGGVALRAGPWAALRLVSERRLILASGAFDTGYYSRSYPDVPASGFDPVSHYLLYGAAEGRNPNALFDTDWYAREYPDVATYQRNPLVDYLRLGARTGRNPSARFDTSAYLAANPDVAAAGVNPLGHYLRFGMTEGRPLRKAPESAPSRREPVSRPSTTAVVLRRTAQALYRRAPLPLGLKVRIKDGLYSRLPQTAGHFPYARWIARNDTLTDDDRSLIEADIASFATTPTFSILMPVYNAPRAYLRQAIESVLNQLYPNWELCVVDDASTESHVRQVMDEWAARDERIRLAFRDSNGGISACSNTALEMSSGDWIVLLDHDDVLAEHALYMVAETINRHSDAAIIYSDEDHIDGNGRRSNPYFKPDWDYDLALGQNLINHLGAYRADLVKQVGGFRTGLEGSQDWDLALRVVEAAPGASIQHVPFVLYHWRQTAQAFSRTSIVRAARAAERSVREHGTRTSQRVDVVVHGDSSYLQTRRRLPAPRPLVSVVIPTRDRPELLRTCLTGLLERTSYDRIEIVIVDNGSTDADAISLLNDVQRRPNVKLVQDAAGFNFSRLVNGGVAASSGDVCVLLNNDIDVINEDWLAEMVSHAMRPDVGAVGAKLYYDNDTIQHAGVILGLGGVAGHAYRARPRDSSGYFGQLHLTHNVSCVTAACLAVRREVYDSVGGFNEKDLSVAFNDVDFCIRVRRTGLKIIWTPHAQLYHYESLSRGYETTPAKARRFRAEAEYMRAKWADVLDSDPFYNSNLSLMSDYRLAEVTRASKPWEARAARSRVPAEANVDRPAAAADTAASTESLTTTTPADDARFTVRRLRPDAATTRYRSVVLVGHSAAGKSRLARVMGLDRRTTDFDAYAVGKPDDRVALFDGFLKSGARLLIAPNDLRLLSDLAEGKASDYPDIAVVYLCRPRDVIRSNLAIVNEDQGRHPAMSPSQFDRHYDLYSSAFMSAADYVLDYRGADIDDIAFAMDALVDALTGGHPLRMSVEDRLNLFHEYYRTRAAGRIARPTLLTEDQMKQMTAGGYQVFDPKLFPPVPALGSIAAKKLNDLRWTADEFAGMTVAEIGSQLGFFGFVAASLGAELVTGTDINPKFVAEANKIAVHYAQLLGWQRDRVMFRTHALSVGDVIPGSPDVVVANSIVHWFIIQNPELSIEDVLSWLRDNASVGVYFEGCVSASEQIMRDHGVSLDRYSEERFLRAASTVFRRHHIVGRCSYNPQRLVARLYR